MTTTFRNILHAVTSFKLTIIIFFLSAITISCTQKKETEVTLLPEYKITNNKLDSITEFVINKSHVLHEDHKRIMVLELNEIGNDTIDFVYSFHESFDALRCCFIELHNKRVVGYINKDSLDIIILTNIDHYDELKKLKTFISLTSNKKEYVKLYRSPLFGLDIESMYEPLCWHFKYKNGVVGKPSLHL